MTTPPDDRHGMCFSAPTDVPGEVREILFRSVSEVAYAAYEFEWRDRPDDPADIDERLRAAAHARMLAREETMSAVIALVSDAYRLDWDDVVRVLEEELDRRPMIDAVRDLYLEFADSSLNGRDARENAPDVHPSP
jgi:hypothetical protein